MIGKLNCLWVSVALLMGCVAGANGQNVTFFVAAELAADNFSLKETAYDPDLGYVEVERTLTLLGSQGSNLMYGADFDFSMGGSFSLTNLSTGSSTGGSFSPGGQSQSFGQWDFLNGSLIQLSFAIPEARSGHVFALWRPDSNEVYPITANGVVGVQGPNGWQSLGFLTARCFNSFDTSSPTWNQPFRLVDLTTNEAASPEQTNTLAGPWTNVAGQLPTMGVSAWVSDTWGYYTLHTSGGSLQSLSVTWSFDGYYIAGQVGLGESFWFTRDVDGATSPTFFCNGDTWFDVRPYISEYTGRSLVTYSFQIGEEYGGRSFNIVHPDGYVSPVVPVEWVSWFQGWDDYGQTSYYSFHSATAEIDTNQSGWALVDSDTGENFGQTTQLGSGYHVEHPSAPSFISLSIRTGRANNGLSLVQDNGEEWAVNILPETYTINGNFMGRNYTIPFRLATAPYLPEWGFHLRDLSIGDDSASIQAGATDADFSDWRLPPTSVQLRIDESRWFNQLHLVQPETIPFNITRGNMQGVWMGGSGGTQFNSFRFYDAASEAHPDVIWLLWDATRNEYIDPDPGTIADFFLAYDGTDTDADGLPDWWERTASGLNPNDPNDANMLDTDGDGRTDRAEFIARTDQRAKDNPDVQLTVSGFTTP